MALFQGKVVGAITTEYCTAEKEDALLDQYNIATFINPKWGSLKKNHSIVRFMIMNPLFEFQARYFCKEIMRQLELYCLVYPGNSAFLHDQATKRIALKEFVPVKPRRTYIFV